MEPPPEPPGAHRFCASAKLRAQLEARRYVGKWEGVRGIVDDNDRISRDGGFALSCGGAWQEVPPAPPAEAVRCPVAVAAGDALAPRFDVTEFCVVNLDTLTAALVLGDACALNFANAKIPGGRYRSGGLAQEEDMCRLLPQLYPSLAASGAYPLAADTALVTRGLLAVRRPGTYEPCASLGECTVITAAMPCGAADRRPKGGWANSPWAETVTLRVRSVLHAARHAGRPDLVLGAFGCGAFGNPAGPVAAIFREQLASLEFRGAFARVVFAIIDPLGTGNLKPFQREMRLLVNGIRIAIEAEVEEQATAAKEEGAPPAVGSVAGAAAAERAAAAGADAGAAAGGAAAPAAGGLAAG